MKIKHLKKAKVCTVVPRISILANSEEGRLSGNEGNQGSGCFERQQVCCRICIVSVSFEGWCCRDYLTLVFELVVNHDLIRKARDVKGVGSLQTQSAQ